MLRPGTFALLCALTLVRAGPSPVGHAGEDTVQYSRTHTSFNTSAGSHMSQTVTGMQRQLAFSQQACQNLLCLRTKL